MDVKFDGFPEIGERIVYVRPVETADLPEDVREQAQGLKVLYSVHDTDGQRIALVADRNMAFLLARQNDYSPVNVH